MKTITLDWIKVEDWLPREDTMVLCYHSFSENYFICYRTKDCNTGKTIWFGNASPTHWQELTRPDGMTICKKCGIKFMQRLFKPLIICEKCEGELIK